MMDHNEDEGFSQPSGSLFEWAEAGGSGDLEALERLVKVSSARCYDSIALRSAVENGHALAVELLLPLSDPFAINSVALKMAAMRGDWDVVEMFWPYYAGREQEFIRGVCEAGMAAGPYVARIEQAELSKVAVNAKKRCGK